MAVWIEIFYKIILIKIFLAIIIYPLELYKFSTFSSSQLNNPSSTQTN